MGLFSKLAKATRKGIPGRDSGGGMGSAMARPAAPRPTLVQGGPAYFTPEGYTPPIQPEQAFMPTDVMRDPIRDMFAAQPPLRSIPGPPPMPPRDITPPPIMCFVAGTKIDMADGTKKVIENIAMGDEVLALNGETDVVSYVHDIPKADRSLWTINDRITATDAHAFLTNDGWKSNNSKLSNTVYNDYGIEVKELQLGDKLITKDGVEEVTKLESEKDFIKVYNFTTSNTHTYMVDGVVSHNKMPPMPPFIGREEPPIMVEDPIVEEPPMDIPMDNMMIDRPMISGLENPNLFNFDFSNIDMDAINQRIADAGGTIPQDPVMPPIDTPAQSRIDAIREARGMPPRIRDDFMSIERMDEPRDEFIPRMPNENPVPFIPPVEMPRDMPPIMPPSFERIEEDPRMPLEEPIAMPRNPELVAEIQRRMAPPPMMPTQDPITQPYEMSVLKEGSFELPEPDMSGKFTPFTQEVEPMPMMPQLMTEPMPIPMQPRMPMPRPIATPTPRLQRPSLPMMPMMGGRGRR